MLGILQNDQPKLLPNTNRQCRLAHFASKALLIQNFNLLLRYKCFFYCNVTNSLPLALSLSLSLSPGEFHTYSQQSTPSHAAVMYACIYTRNLNLTEQMNW